MESANKRNDELESLRSNLESERSEFQVSSEKYEKLYNENSAELKTARERIETLEKECSDITAKYASEMSEMESSYKSKLDEHSTDMDSRHKALMSDFDEKAEAVESLEMNVESLSRKLSKSESDYNELAKIVCFFMPTDLVDTLSVSTSKVSKNRAIDRAIALQMCSGLP